MKIFYLHGFRSHYQNSSKVKFLKKKFGDDFISYDLFDSPLENIRKVIKNILDNSVREEKMFIGTSLGGFYANYLSNRFRGHSLLINPVIKPHIHMKKNYYLQELTCFTDNSKSICIDEKAISEFEKMFYELENNDNNSLSRTIWRSKNDLQITNTDEIYDYYKSSEIQLFDDNHRFEKFEKCFEKWFPKKINEIKKNQNIDTGYDRSVVWLELADYKSRESLVFTETSSLCEN